MEIIDSSSGDSRDNIFATSNLTNALRPGGANGNRTGVLRYKVPTNEDIASIEAIAYGNNGGVNSPEGLVYATYEFDLWIKKITQENKLIGNTAQSKYTRHFYPKSYGPGDYSITGIARSQQDLQELAKFIRTHQEYMVSGDAFTRGAANPHGTSSLLTLLIPNENIWVRGWIPRFTLSKRGVFEPAPEYTFNFTIGFDDRTFSRPNLSHIIRAWYSAGEDEVKEKDIPKTQDIPQS